MKKKSTGLYEFLLVVVVIVLILLPQLVGTTAITDETKGLNEDGYPVTATRVEDLKKPGVKLGSPTVDEWIKELERCFPEAEVINYSNMANLYEVGEDNGTGVEMTLTYRGEDEDPLAGSDELSAAMIRHSCRELTHTCEQGLYTVRARL